MESDQIGKCCHPLGWLGLHKSSVIRVGEDDVGGTAPEENGNQQFLGGIVDLAEIRVISSGLDSAVPAEILGSAR